MVTRSNNRRGFLLMDLLVGLAIATALLLAFSTAVGALHRAQHQMADDRAAARRLEETLITLQAGGKADPDIRLERLPGDVAGHAWVRLSLLPPNRGHSAPTLVGLVPADRAPGGTP